MESFRLRKCLKKKIEKTIFQFFFPMVPTEHGPDRTWVCWFVCLFVCYEGVGRNVQQNGTKLIGAKV